MSLRKPRKNLWDRIAPRYDANFRQDYYGLIEKITGELDSSDAVLDIACGTGLISFEAAKKCASVTGVDLSEDMIRVAKGKKADFGTENIEFLAGDAMRLSGVAGRFDAVILCNILHVAEKPARVVEEAKRFLSPAGRIILATYCHGEPLRFKHALFSRGMYLLHKLGRIPYMHRLSFQDVLAVCGKGGLTVERSELIAVEGFPCAFVVASSP